MFGVHPNDNKLTRRKKIVRLPIPQKAIIPLSQHIGAPNNPVVDVGDLVKTGQVIGRNDAFVSANVHATISGKVVAIEDHYTTMGTKCKSVVIESDGKDEWVELISNADLPAREKVMKLKEMGLVGMGGATFPTHVKLSPPEGKEIKKIILNGAECEPYLTCDNRLMIEDAEEIIKGLEIVMDISGCKEAYIGIEANKPNALRILKRASKKAFGINVVKIPQRYPQGAEKVLINTITGEWVPAGGLPIDIGIVVLNVGTTKAIYDAIVVGKPLVERVVTVTGDVHEPRNILARIGTPMDLLIEACKGYVNEPKKIISGGPMMGIAQFKDDSPIMKGSSGILVLNEINESAFEEKPCTRCAKCVDACPMNLLPVGLQKASRAGAFELTKNLNAMDCFECGCCAYVCPCKIPIVQLIKDAKNEIRKMGKK